MLSLRTRNLLYAQVNDPFFLLLGVPKCGRSAAIAVDNVRHDHICGIDHPSVPPAMKQRTVMEPSPAVDGSYCHRVPHYNLDPDMLTVN